MPIGSLAAITLSAFLSCRTHENMPSRCFGASMPYCSYSGIITSQSEWVLNGYGFARCFRSTLWLYISPLTASAILPSSLSKGCAPESTPTILRRSWTRMVLFAVWLPLQSGPLCRTLSLLSRVFHSCTHDSLTPCPFAEPSA